jgi:RNA polymerase sigma-70 factor (ECF subfamily)
MLMRALDRIHRQDGWRLLAGLIRRLGDFDVAEEALQDAYAKALERWPRDGVPENPQGWLATVALRRGLDVLKRARRSVAFEEAHAPACAGIGDRADVHGDGSDDERLSLIFTCCHPALAPAAQIALALRVLCGLTTAQIARAFVEPEATTAQKIVRAKRKIAQARIPFAVPPAEELADRLAAVLAVVYFTFNEGYAAFCGAELLRPDLCSEAIRLGRILNGLLPDQPEVPGLLALMLLQHSRRDARVDGSGALVTLEEQRRDLWDRTLIAEATALLDGAVLRRRPGPYQIQAAIAAVHANAASAEATDWWQISALYSALLRLQPTPVVELNAAVALAMASSMDEGLAWIRRIEAGGAIDDYHLLHAAKADLLRRNQQIDAAREAYQRAIALARNDTERNYLRRRLGELRRDA